MDKGLMPQEPGGEPDGIEEMANAGFPFGMMMGELIAGPGGDPMVERLRRETLATLANATENLSIATAILARMAQDEFFAK